jgi:hypothetical protein
MNNFCLVFLMLCTEVLMFKGNGAEFYYYFGHNGQKQAFATSLAS